MAKIKKGFFCQSCGYESPKWLGKCPSCNQWNTFVEEIIHKSEPIKGDWKQETGSKKRVNKPILVNDIEDKEAGAKKLPFFLSAIPAVLTQPPAQLRGFSVDGELVEPRSELWAAILSEALRFPAEKQTCYHTRTGGDEWMPVDAKSAADAEILHNIKCLQLALATVTLDHADDMIFR